MLHIGRPIMGPMGNGKPCKFMDVNSKAKYCSEQGLNGKTVKVLSDYLAHLPV